MGCSIRDALLRDENCGLYCVLVKEGTIDESRITAFDHQAWWTNTDWVRDYLNAFVRKCLGDFAVYFVGHNNRGELSVFRLVKGGIRGKEFDDFLAIDEVALFDQYIDDWEEITEDEILS